MKEFPTIGKEIEDYVKSWADAWHRTGLLKGYMTI